MEALINQDAIRELVNERVDQFLKSKEIEPRTARLTPKVRKDYFHGKSAEWIRTFIFDAYPETNEINGGWVLNPRKVPGGRTTSLQLSRARKWLDKHELEIDWNAKLPN